MQEGDLTVDMTRPLDPTADYQDWNNKHPWVVGNEWNRFSDGNSRSSLDSLPLGNGGQTVKYHDFTYIPMLGGGTERESAAYSYGCQDTPFEYNGEMYEQRFILNHYVSNDVTHDNMNYGQFGTEWLVNTAPGGDYNNYVRTTPQTGEPTERQALRNFVTINGESYFPYRPGWSLQHWRDDYFWVNAISAGVDCNGLIQISVGYAGNTYVWGELHRHDPTDRGSYTTGGMGNRVFPLPERRGSPSWEITNSRRINSITSVIADGQKVVPGDVIYRGGSYPHVMIVQNVVFAEDGRTVRNVNIEIIESTYGETNIGVVGKIINSQDLNDYLEDSWRILRLKTVR